MKSEIQQSFDTDLTRQDVQDLSRADAVTSVGVSVSESRGKLSAGPDQ
jgi:hypothetical protein